MHRLVILIIAALLTTVLSTGCGGGGGGGNLPQKSAEMTFSTTSTDPAVQQINGVSIAVTLPVGVTVATEPGSNQISTASLQGVGVQVLGSYSAPIRKVKIGTLPGTIPLGPYARLNCAVQPGFTLSENDFTSIVPLEFQPTGPGGSDLTSKVSSSISVVFGY